MGFHPKGWSHLHVVFSHLFSPRQFIFRRRRVRRVFPPEPEDLLNTLIGNTEENFIVFKGFPAPALSCAD